ncbi:MAG: class I SAM-dependent methyltransferase [Gammaproteobacteria bacterium]|nr:class I SAM-dependent methyltransferase [Gammaproteobacteria bacterium]
MSESNAFVSWEDAVRWLKAQPEQRALVESAYYDDPLIVAAERYWVSAEWAGIRAYLPDARGRALDVGSGRGISAYALAKEGYRVSALEPDPSPYVGAGAIRMLAEESQLPIEVSESVAEKVPFNDRQFDLVFARAALHHAHDLGGTCHELFRVLKPGGRLIAVREHVITRRRDLAVFLSAHPLHRLYGGENAYLLLEYTAALEAAGFYTREVLAPLLSPINYAPQSITTLRAEIISKVSRIPGAATVLRGLLGSDALMRVVLRGGALIDNRPGRLYSFICDKAAAD